MNAAKTATRVYQKEHNKAAVKALAKIHGIREAARLSGFNENTVKSWAYYGKWNLEKHSPVSHPNGSHTLASVSERVQRTLETRKLRSRVNMSRYSVKASGELAQAPKGKALALSKHAVNVASVIEKTWPEERATNDQPLINVNILNARP